MVAKHEFERCFAIPAPAAWVPTGYLADLDDCSPAFGCKSSSLPLAFCDVKSDDESDNEDSTETTRNWTCDLELGETSETRVTTASTNMRSNPRPPYFTLGENGDHDERTDMMLYRRCEACYILELQHALLELMCSESAGPFLQPQRNNGLGLHTIRQRLNGGRYVDAVGHTRPEMFWSDIDECLNICESIGRLPFLVWEMRTLAEQLEEGFWSFRNRYESIFHTRDPGFSPLEAVAFVVRSNIEDLLDVCLSCQVVDELFQWGDAWLGRHRQIDTCFTNSESSVVHSNITACLSD